MEQATASPDVKRKKGAKFGYYGVKAGHKTGVFTEWSECQKQVTKFAGAQFKGFTNLSDAEAYVKGLSTPASSGAKPQAYYAVRSGHVPGIYTSWPEAQKNITGANRPMFRKFSTKAEAEEFMGIENISPDYPEPKDSKKRKAAASSQEEPEAAPKREKLKPVDSQEVSEDDLLEALQFGNIEADTRNAKPAWSPSPITIYTDGSCLANGKTISYGGIGVFFGPSDARNISEPLDGDKQTNNRAELTAILKALRVIDQSQSVHIISDSDYSIKCVTMWYRGWERNNWRTSKGLAVENKDLIVAIRALMETRESKEATTKLSWIKGHAASAGNEAADRLARSAAEQVMRQRSR